MSSEPNPPRRRQCGTPQNYHRLLEADPGFRDRQVALERRTREMRLTGSARLADGPARIPVVVHVVFNDPAENISTAQVESQIEVLNADFRAHNADLSGVPSVWSGLVADANIEFALATTDPQEQPTDGITRTETSASSFGVDDAVKFTASGGIDAWPADRYLNIWVCNLRGVLGYAQFPGGDAATDGVVILHSAFGTTGTAEAPFNLGRTTTHEVGHYFNLIHIWGDTNDCSGSDLVDDTPPARLPNYHKPQFPHASCPSSPDGDMFMNFMDYVDDDSMFMFTQGQVERMTATLLGARSALVEA